jgi:hypothetical protein
MVSDRTGSVMLLFVRSDSISMISNRTGGAMLCFARSVYCKKYKFEKKKNIRDSFLGHNKLILRSNSFLPLNFIRMS